MKILNKSEKEKQEKKLLSNYIPEVATNTIYKIIKINRVHLTISRKRRSKLGDYRAPIRGNGHKISVNHNLNRYSFLNTLMHEIAHLEVFKKYKTRVKPHGKEWQNVYRDLIYSMIQLKAFPDELIPFLQKHIIKPTASSNTDLSLHKALKKYDANAHALTIEDIDDGEKFALEDGKIFKKIKKMRTRYKCTHLKTNIDFSVHPLTPINRIQ